MQTFLFTKSSIICNNFAIAWCLGESGTLGFKIMLSNVPANAPDP